jgi:hypothetical protein
VKVAWLSLEWPRAGHHSGGVGRYTYRLAAQLRDMVALTVIAPHDALILGAWASPTAHFLFDQLAKRNVGGWRRRHPLGCLST